MEVLHQNGENTSHYVNFFGYREVPQFTKELIAEHTKEQTSVIDEKTEIFSEIAQEHANDEPDRENEVFLVNYNEWHEVSTLDFEQNYFAIDDPYADGDFRLCICRTRSRTSRLQECITILMRKLLRHSMKQSGKWRICLSIKKITLVPTW